MIIEKATSTTLEIEHVRIILENLIEVFSLSHSLTIQVSQYLDKLINEDIQNNNRLN